MRLLAAVALMSVLPTAANAAPVYLSCVVNTQNDGDLAVDVQLNEDGGTASYSFPRNGNSFTVRAIFTPDKVSFRGFEISRTDLTIQRINDGAFNRIRNDPPSDRGRCQIDQRDRAF